MELLTISDQPLPLSPAEGLPELSLAPGDLPVLLTIIFLLVLSALVSAAGTGFISLSGKGEKPLPGDEKNRRLLAILADRERLLSTIVILNLLLNGAIIVLIASLFLGFLPPGKPPAGILLLMIATVSLIILLFGEIIPRLIASRFPLAIARTSAWPLSLMMRLFRPVSSLLLRASNNTSQKKTSKNISVDEITQALELTSRNDISEEKEILRGIVNFGNKTADEIMVPRVDVIAVDVKSSFTEVLGVINHSGYSRIPVYSESFDQIRGILYIKDLLPYTEKGENFQWQNLLRPPFFVPETKKVKDLLEEFQKNKIHMAVVVDEYGGSSGIVTLEDVLEEIVGDIADEFDEDETLFTRMGDNKFLFDGKTLLEQFCETVGCEPDFFDAVRGEADTLAGLILELKGDIPSIHEKVEYENFRFTIESVTNRRVRQIRTEIL